jgi:hypothetical protein
MTNLGKIYKGTVVFILLLCSYKTFPQSAKVGQDLLFKNQIKFSVAPVLYDNLQLTYTGERLLKTNPCI